ncbi:hypothetical protein [Muriicola soli]|uniref:Uncharacterized protein n=1 Tax=Muriicola soli TaxID=2507538 RepID=A0A411EA61_9FLAO|nr:hypothetical protein [Muriicola soli]QBA64602.1 hypothetical protein EQY75_08725 [Muriicola soli]
MKLLFKKPYYFFFPASLILIALGFIIPLVNFDFNIKDTYVVVQQRWVFHLLALFGFLIALVYWIMSRTGKKLRYRLNAIHVGTSLFGPILIFMSSLFYKEVLHLRGSEEIGMKMELLEANYHNNSVSLVIVALVTITLVVQLVFPVNILMAFLNKREEQKD